ncbi:MAG TPA: phosphate ABC transporter substrate-binding protein PstS [Trebonia sp.]
MNVRARLASVCPRRPRWLAGRTRTLRLLCVAISVVFALGAVELGAVHPSQAASAAPAAASYVPITGSGSTWVFPAMNNWITDVHQFRIRVSYSESGSTQGRNDFKAGLADFGASEIPYGVTDGTFTDPPPDRGYAYIPDAAGGTTFMYNLNINGHRVTNLRLSGAVVAGIFTNKITMWNDRRIKADNPGLNLPALKIVPVVRSDGSGATADFTQWMIATEGSYWTAYCRLVGRSPCTQTSSYPVPSGNTAMHALSGDTGVSGYVAQAGSNGAIGYVEFSYALQTGFPVAKLLNKAGYYTEPTPGHVAVSLLAAKLNTNQKSATYLTENLSAVYTDRDPRTYELSAYSYMIIPTDLNKNGHLTTAKGYTLGAFGQYMLCNGQRNVDTQGYSALPIDLVQRGFAQLRRIPGSTVPTTDTSAIAQCHNPTFSTNGTNTLAANDPRPPACDHIGPVQCTSATGGAPGSGGAFGNNSGGGGGSGAGTAGGGGTAGGAGAAGAAAAGAAAGGAGGAAGVGGTSGGQTCDPNTGICSGPGASGAGTGALSNGGQLTDNPLNLAASNGDGQKVMLMAIAAGLLFSLAVAPPLMAQGARRRRRRLGIDEFYGREEDRR